MSYLDAIAPFPVGKFSLKSLKVGQKMSAADYVMCINIVSRYKYSSIQYFSLHL